MAMVRADADPIECSQHPPTTPHSAGTEAGIRRPNEAPVHHDLPMLEGERQNVASHAIMHGLRIDPCPMANYGEIVADALPEPCLGRLAARPLRRREISDLLQQHTRPQPALGNVHGHAQPRWTSCLPLLKGPVIACYSAATPSAASTPMTSNRLGVESSRAAASTYFTPSRK